jgi:hypothetical protein
VRRLPVEAVVKHGLEPRGRPAAALKAGHPVAVADHDVVERAVDAFEKRLPILFALGI